MKAKIINVAGDYVKEKHIGVEIRNVKAGGIGVQINNSKPTKQWIDLGLPSGNLWAATNETNSDGTPYFLFDEAVALFSNVDGASDNVYLPSREDYEELLSECYHRWNNERKCLEFYSPKTKQILVFQANGERSKNNYIVFHEYGYYWTATQRNKIFGIIFGFEYGKSCLSTEEKLYGLSVRQIKKGGNNA